MARLPLNIPEENGIWESSQRTTGGCHSEVLESRLKDLLATPGQGGMMTREGRGCIFIQWHSLGPLRGTRGDEHSSYLHIGKRCSPGGLCGTEAVCSCRSVVSASMQLGSAMRGPLLDQRNGSSMQSLRNQSSVVLPFDIQI
jgi:hypothetical protein